MKKILFYFFLIFIVSCSEDENQLKQDSPNLQTRSDQNECGSFSCNFTEINASNYDNLCEVQIEIFNQLNSCTISYDNPTCISTTGTPPPGFTLNARGYLETDVATNTDLLYMFLGASLTPPPAVYCSLVRGEDDWLNCEQYDPSFVNLSANGCSPTSGGWVVTTSALSSFANGVKAVACEYGSSISCGTGYVLKPISIEFYVGSLTLCGDCNITTCPNGYSYVSGCSGYRPLFRVLYSCCEI